MTPVEVAEAGDERMKLWHSQNVVNANFFTAVLKAAGATLKGGKDIERKHLYLLPNEKIDTDYIDTSTPEGLQKIKELIANDSSS